MKRPKAARFVGMPRSRNAKIAAIEKLTKEINKIEAHLGKDPKNFHDGRARKSFEFKIHRRGELLEAFAEQRKS